MPQSRSIHSLDVRCPVGVLLMNESERHRRVRGGTWVLAAMPALDIGESGIKSSFMIERGDSAPRLTW